MSCIPVPTSYSTLFLSLSTLFCIFSSDFFPRFFDASVSLMLVGSTAALSKVLKSSSYVSYLSMNGLKALYRLRSSYPAFGIGLIGLIGTSLFNMGVGLGWPSTSMTSFLTSLTSSSSYSREFPTDWSLLSISISYYSIGGWGSGIGGATGRTLTLGTPLQVF